MRIRHTVLAAAAGSALLAAAVLPAAAVPQAHAVGKSPADLEGPVDLEGPADLEGPVDLEGPADLESLADVESSADVEGSAGREGSVDVESSADVESSVGAAALLAKVMGCTQISMGRYRKDAGASATVRVCQKRGAVFFKADMDIDCDGKRTSKCNSTTDPWFQSSTAFQQSDGTQLDAEKLPFIVVPTASAIWNYRSSGVMGGTVAAVIYKDRVQYAVVGDTGPSGIIGEASYATAKALGITPDPRVGGVASGVTYILFTNSRVSPIESHSGAVTLGEALAEKFLQDN